MNLKKWIERSGIPAATVAERLGVRSATLYKWLSTNTLPRRQTLIKIMRFTHREVKPEDFCR